MLEELNYIETYIQEHVKFICKLYHIKYKLINKITFITEVISWQIHGVGFFQAVKCLFYVRLGDVNVIRASKG